MTAFTERALDVISSIPPGRVATYGQVAACAGAPRGARQVVRILSSMSNRCGLSWHRIVNREGRIALPRGGGYELQKALLEQEGIRFDETDRIDFSLYRWEPGP